eukprot:gnl/Dysnectes_brevis/1330_a1493_3186.p2 GENE.gnl/Dysnectes_brevis/1330_a1493_3186~~gnl/Dysnectes_brevis/1330_a1493_3186.p2  ORF type:complete len:162 (+),score=33.94 gnl/Dysnectes_brevis/1330_a1493_3186:674-1159(+)
MAELPIFEDKFTVTHVDKEGKFFDIVSRINLNSLSDPDHVNLTLDINSDLYPQLVTGAQVTISLQESLKLFSHTGESVAKATDPEYHRSLRSSLEATESPDYAMCGTVFEFRKHKEIKNIVKVYASFGGLIMELSAPPDRLTGFKHGQKLYLLAKGTRAPV